jgi:hypothetical protein
VPTSECTSNVVRVDVQGRVTGVVEFRRGDTTGSGTLDLTGGGRILSYLFRGDGLECLDAADTDDNGRVEMSDGIRIFQYLFRGGVNIPGVGVCLQDSISDQISCDKYDVCD